MNLPMAPVATPQGLDPAAIPALQDEVRELAPELTELVGRQSEGGRR